MLFYHPIIEQETEKGFISGKIKGEVLCIENVFVIPGFRGSRLAAKAMAELVHYAIKNGMKKISLRAMPYGEYSESKNKIEYAKGNQKRLTRYYKTMGFKTVKPYHLHIMELNL